MSFKLKTVLGVAAIEILLLAILVFSGLHYLKTSNEARIFEQAHVSARLLATMTADATVAWDLATLDELVNQAARNSGIIYARIRSADGKILSQSHSVDGRSTEFVEDLEMRTALEDGVLDVFAPIQIDGRRFARVELGVSTDELSKTVNDARDWMLSIAATEIVLVAIFGLLLGSLLTRQLYRLQKAARRVAGGEFGFETPVVGEDELAQTAASFNEMSRALKLYKAKQENLQQNLKDAEARLQSAFQNVTVGIVVADARGKIILCNAKILEFFGYSEDELVGRNVSVLANGRDAERHDQYLEAFASTGVAKIIGSGREVVGRHKDGREFPVSLGIAEMSLDGEVQYIASLVDLTEQKALSQQLRQSQKMEAIGQLVGGIAHDFNNLLGIIMGNLDLMQRQVDPESRLSRQLEKALGATERAANLTARLLGFSRQTPTSREPVDVQETIANLIELLQKSVTEQVKITLAPTSCSCFASADKGDLEDAVTNLCINARDAMPGGGSIYIETRRVAISEQDHHLFKDLVTGDYVEISVTDDGQGIPVEIIDHIFDPFFSTKEKGKGTGLGLSMVYGFAKRSGGAVSCYSEEGIGTTFKIYLPCVEAAAIMPAGPSDRAMLEEPVRGEGAILVVDDEPDIQDIAENILTGAGYTVLRANTGKEAMDVLAERAPEISLVVSDVIMPGGVSGHDLADKVAQSYPSIKVCLASGFTGSLSSHQVGNEAVPLLKKPYSNVELTKFVAMVLNKESH